MQVLLKEQASQKLCIHNSHETFRAAQLAEPGLESANHFLFHFCLLSLCQVSQLEYNMMAQMCIEEEERVGEMISFPFLGQPFLLQAAVAEFYGGICTLPVSSLGKAEQGLEVQHSSLSHLPQLLRLALSHLLSLSCSKPLCRHNHLLWSLTVGTHHHWDFYS